MAQPAPQGTGGLTAVFYKKALPNNFKTEQEGRPIFDDVDMIKIYISGDSNNVIDTLVREDHKQRFPHQWQNYVNQHGSDPSLSGTPLEQWPLITKAQAEELKAMKFFTVENVASASDGQLSRLGMMAGMSPYAFRDRAVNFLKVAKDEADVSLHEQTIAKLEQENAKLKAETDAKIAEMQQQMASVLAAVGEKKPRKRKAETVEGT